MPVHFHSTGEHATTRTMSVPVRFVLHDPTSFLRLFESGIPSTVRLDDVDVAQVWALVGLAALARRNGQPSLHVDLSLDSNVGRFAHAIGLRDVIEETSPGSPGDPGRTYKIRRVQRIDEVEAAAREIAELIVGAKDHDEAEETQKTLRYVLLELMRNAVQHSCDPKGGVVAAQRMDAGYPGYTQATIQVAVADAGIGIQAALASSYPELTDPETALAKALEPHVSGKFGPGLTGSTYNAGMGLFFIAEMAKLADGCLLLSSQGASLTLRGAPMGDDGTPPPNSIVTHGLGFPGTLVAFELPVGSVVDHTALLEVIRDAARQRTPSRTTRPWIRFEAAPPDAKRFQVLPLVESTEAAAQLSRETLQRHLFNRQPIVLDFDKVSLCTQSFLHALLFETIRISWAVQTPIYVENTVPAVRVGIDLVDNYARGG